jgi:hypothetical protein
VEETPPPGRVLSTTNETYISLYNAMGRKSIRKKLIKSTEKSTGFSRPLSSWQISTWVVLAMNLAFHYILFSEIGKLIIFGVFDFLLICFLLWVTASDPTDLTVRAERLALH